MALLLAGFTGFVPSPAGETSASGRTSLAVEALNRLKGLDIESNPALKSAVLKVVDSTKGTPQFVELVRDFKVPGQEPALLKFAQQQPGDPAAVEAIRLVLAHGDRGLVQRALAGTNALAIVQLLGKAAAKTTVPMLEGVLHDDTRDPALRVQATHALVQTREGAETLLHLGQSSALPDVVKSAAATDLRQAHWPEIQRAAHELWPPPFSNDAQPLPSISELVKEAGDSVRGAEVFRRETVGCTKCHQVNGQGTDFGPNLSEIGTKLAKEAIYEAILDPSAGLSFGYEPWQIELKNGDEAFGLLASETNDEIAIKSQTGIVTRYRKSDIARKVQQKTSIMPAGLALTMSRQDLIDLVAFLASLRKASP